MLAMMHLITFSSLSGKMIMEFKKRDAIILFVIPPIVDVTTFPRNMQLPGSFISYVFLRFYIMQQLWSMSCYYANSLNGKRNFLSTEKSCQEA